MKQKVIDILTGRSSEINQSEFTSWAVIEENFEMVAEDIVKFFAKPDVINTLPEYNEILFHAKILTNEQFRKYWDEVQGNVL